MIMPPAADVLFQSIKKTTMSGSFLKRIQEGCVHEACLIMGAWALARDCGLDANLIELRRCPKPTEEHGDALTDVVGGICTDDVFLEIQGHLIGLRFDHFPSPALDLLAYESREHVLNDDGYLNEWNIVEEEWAMGDADRGIIELSVKNDLDVIRAELQQLSMQMNTGPALSKPPTGPRL